MDVLDKLPLPTLDRPFGIALWPIFSKAWEAVVGYPAEEFGFKTGYTPMSTLKETSIFVVIYYIIILGGREVMRNREPFKLKGLFLIHNLMLTLVSLALLLLFLEQLIPTVARHGLFYAICDHDGGWTQPLVVLYYLNYLTKYLELLDTVFLFLKKKPLTFLHCYHHGATAVLCYTQLIGSTAVSWTVITLNLTVHVVMYWYYFQSARGIRIWWKKYITIGQITQFVLDIGFIYFASWTYFTSTYWPHLPNMGKCAGEEFAAISGICIITSYLFLFLAFYFASYTYFTSTYFPNMPSAGKCAGEEFAAFAGIGIISSYLVLFISFYLATYKKEGKKTTSRKSLRRMSQAPMPDPHDLLAATAGASASSTGAKTNGTPTHRSRKA